MDQMVVACAQRDAAMLLDCRSLESFAVNLPRDVSIFIVHSGVRRGLVESAYNERRAQCTAAAEILGVEFLCDAKEATLNAHREMMPDLIFSQSTPCHHREPTLSKFRSGDAVEFQTCRALELLERIA